MPTPPSPPPQIVVRRINQEQALQPPPAATAAAAALDPRSDLARARATGGGSGRMRPPRGG